MDKTNQLNISIENILVSINGNNLIDNSNLKINYGGKYGLIGRNGSGKSTLLRQIYDKTIPINKSIDVFYVNQELDFDPNKTIYEIVSDANRKKNKLTKRLNELTNMLENDIYDSMTCHTDEYNKIIEKLNSIDYQKDESIIRKILRGLGFTNIQQDKPFSKFSGGWKMRVSLARGLYMKPTLLLLDEPTNHLDLNSVIWLIDYLVHDWKKSLIVVSHDTFFLNEICTNIIHLNNNKLNYYKGNYDNFKKAFDQQISEIDNIWSKAQKRIKELKKEGKSNESINEYLIKNQIIEPLRPYKVNIKFPRTDDLNSPLMNIEDVSFGYDEQLFENITQSLYNNDKITIVGKNGVGKSTLMQLIYGSLAPKTGIITKDQRIKIGYYTQHLSEKLPNDVTPIKLLMMTNVKLKEFDARKYLGNIGLVGTLHTQLIEKLSGGQKARVLLALICAVNPHILLLDEPTNHLDVESIDSLISAINEFNGAVIMITHNIDVIEKTKSKILMLKNKHLTEITFNYYYKNILNDAENN